MASLVEICAKEGYDSVTVRQLSARAGVSTKSFYDLFPNIEGCFSSAYVWIAGEAVRKMAEAGRPGHERLRGRFEAFLTLFAEHPDAARTVLLEPFAAGPAAMVKERAWARALSPLVCADLEPLSGDSPTPPWMVQGVIAALFQFARQALLSGESVDVTQLATHLVRWTRALAGTSSLWLSRVERRSLGRAPELAPVERQIGDDRRRLLDAAVRLAMANGYSELTGPSIRRTAEVTRRFFDANFPSVADCFLAAVEAQLMDAVARAEQSAVAAPTWARGVARATDLIYMEVSRNPTLSRLAFTDVLSPGVQGLERRGTIIASLAARVRASAPDEVRPSALLTEASLAAAWAIAESESGRTRRDPAAAPVVAYVLLAPLVGSEVANQSIRQEFGLTS